MVSFCIFIQSSLILDWDSRFSEKVCCLSEGLHSTVQFLFKGGGCWPHFFPSDLPAEGQSYRTCSAVIFSRPRAGGKIENK